MLADGARRRLDGPTPGDVRQRPAPRFPRFSACKPANLRESFRAWKASHDFELRLKGGTPIDDRLRG